MLQGAEAVPIRWTAPEILQSRQANKYLKMPYSKEGDVWSYGVIIYEVFSGACTPYSEELTLQQVEEQVCSQDEPLRLSRAKQCPDQLWVIQQNCFADKQHRPTFEKITQELNSAEQDMPDKQVSLREKQMLVNLIQEDDGIYRMEQDT